MEMKALNLPHYKLKLRDVSKQLYLQYEWNMPDGFIGYVIYGSVMRHKLFGTLSVIIMQPFLTLKIKI